MKILQKVLGGLLFLTHTVCTEWPRKNCTEFDAPSFRNYLQQNHVVFAKLLRKKSLSTSQCKMCISCLNILWETAGIGCMIRATSRCVWTIIYYMAPLTVEDGLLINNSQTEKAGLCWKNYCWVSRETMEMLFDLLWIIESTGFAKRLSGSNRHRSDELV